MQTTHTQVFMCLTKEFCHEFTTPDLNYCVLERSVRKIGKRRSSSRNIREASVSRVCLDTLTIKIQIACRRLTNLAHTLKEKRRPRMEMLARLQHALGKLQLKE